MKRLLTLLLAITMLSTSAFAWTASKVDMDTVGVDVGASDWAMEELVAAGQADLVPELYGDPSFTDSITRLQFAQLVVNYVEIVLGEELPADAEGTFADCTNEDVLKASAAGIVTGVGEGLFEPDTTTDREQIATMLSRAIAYINANSDKALAPLTGDLSAFTDGGQVSDWAVDGVSLLAANGIMNGTSTTTLSPHDPCTIEQSILLVYRLYAA